MNFGSISCDGIKQRSRSKQLYERRSLIETAVYASCCAAERQPHAAVSTTSQTVTLASM
jgi:hypothetical protein